MPRVLISRPLPDAVIARAKNLFDVELRAETQPMSAEEMICALQDFDGVMPTLGDMFSADIFAAAPAPRTRILANFGVGYNHIDAKAAQAAGLVVTNTPGAVTDATADIAMTLILMSARRAAEGERLARSGTWQGWHPTQMLGLHVTGRKVGIVGMGRIGQAIARRCHYGFGMEVFFHNRSPKTVDLPATQLETLTDLAAQVDILVTAVPGGAETYHLIDSEVFSAMQSHAHFINIARGDVVDEAALIHALDTEQIGGAGLDVYEQEPAIPASLRESDKVTLLPHLGTAALNVRTDKGMLVLDNLQAFFDGKPPPNTV
ncbi:MAG: 2-hydroxyacid dehydrogenase [Thalassovita sp.]